VCVCGGGGASSSRVNLFATRSGRSGGWRRRRFRGTRLRAAHASRLAVANVPVASHVRVVFRRRRQSSRRRTWLRLPRERATTTVQMDGSWWNSVRILSHLTCANIVSRFTVDDETYRRDNHPLERAVKMSTSREQYLRRKRRVFAVGGGGGLTSFRVWLLASRIRLRFRVRLCREIFSGREISSNAFAKLKSLRWRLHEIHYWLVKPLFFFFFYAKYVLFRVRI